MWDQLSVCVIFGLTPRFGLTPSFGLTPLICYIVPWRACYHFNWYALIAAIHACNSSEDTICWAMCLHQRAKCSWPTMGVHAFAPACILCCHCADFYEMR